jgi:peptide chain release factor
MMFLQISASTGPEECCLAVKKALAQLLIEAHQAQIKIDLIEQVDSEKPGNLRSVLLALDGPQAQALGQRWQGSVQWVCKSLYRPQHRRKNWFIGVQIFSNQTTTTPLNLQDVAFETLRSSGPGGQHVNKTESAVRATHLPSGLSVKVQTQRSQHANKRLSLELLGHKLAHLEQESQTQARAQRRLQHHQLERGNADLVFWGEDFESRTQAGLSMSMN